MHLQPPAEREGPQNELASSCAPPQSLMLWDRTNPMTLFPIHRRPLAVARLLRAVKRIWPRTRTLMTKRYTDAPPDPRRGEEIWNQTPVLAGNIGRRSRL